MCFPSLYESLPRLHPSRAVFKDKVPEDGLLDYAPCMDVPCEPHNPSFLRNQRPHVEVEAEMPSTVSSRYLSGPSLTEARGPQVKLSSSASLPAQRRHFPPSADHRVLPFAVCENGSDFSIPAAVQFVLPYRTRMLAAVPESRLRDPSKIRDSVAALQRQVILVIRACGQMGG